MATGLLVLGLGRATRLLTYLVGVDKTYTATIRLGQTTVSDDAEGEITATTPAEVPADRIEQEAALLRGRIQQVPSTVSAIKVDGQRAYARARAGEQVELDARAVTIHEFTILGVHHTHLPGPIAVTDVEVRVSCSSGTYVRALARDLGAALGVGGHLTALRRSHVGSFDLTQAGPLPESAPADADPGTPLLLDTPAFLPLASALAATFPIRIATDPEARALSFGQAIGESLFPGVAGVLGAGGEAVALVENRDGQAKPLLVFAPA